MRAKPLTDRLDSPEALAHHLDGLMRRDARLKPIREVAGEFAPRVTTPGFAGIAKVICGQQLSVASARAIWARFEALDGALDPLGYLKLEEAAVRAAGFSAGKFRTVRIIAEAIVGGELDFARIDALPSEEAIPLMTRLKGVGPWTAELYLMFCAGHPDIFPSGDLALQKAVGHGLGLDERPMGKALAEIAAPWAPHRAAAALMFWRYFAVIREKEGIIL